MIKINFKITITSITISLCCNFDGFFIFNLKIWVISDETSLVRNFDMQPYTKTTSFWTFRHVIWTKVDFIRNFSYNKSSIFFCS